MKKTLLKLWHVGDSIESGLFRRKVCGVSVYWVIVGVLVIVAFVLAFDLKIIKVK